MIQTWIKDELSKSFTDMECTVDYKTGDDNTLTVYMEDTGEPSNNDFEMLYPSYSVELTTSRRREVESMAWKVYDTMNKRHQEIAYVDDRAFLIVFIHAIPPLSLGIENQKMTYTVNLQTTIRRVK